MEVESVDSVSTVGLAANFSLTGFFPSPISSRILETKLSRAVLLSPGVVSSNLPGKESPGAPGRGHMKARGMIGTPRGLESSKRPGKLGS